MTHCVSLVLASEKTVLTVGMPTPMRMIAGMMVSAISSAGLPCVCFGISWPLIAEPDDHEDDGREDDDADDPGDEEHRPLQVLNALSIRTGGLPCVLRSILRAAAEHDRRSDTGQADDQSLFHRSHGTH